MAYVTLSKRNLKDNFDFLKNLFDKNEIEWAIVSKLLCGTKNYLELLCSLDINEICDSRISNLATIKDINPNINTVYIKPPAKDNIKELVRYADVSFNTEYDTIKWISEEAVRQDKQHNVIIMVELGDLREGVLGDKLLDFYRKVFNLPNIIISGIGSNLNCLHGVLPSSDKLIQLTLYKKLIEATFDENIKWVTGGTSVVLPLLFKKQIPPEMNHFRIGESLYFGNDLITGELIEGMNDDVFRLHTQVIEITDKPKVPTGMMEANPSGEMYEVEKEDYGKTAYRALIDVGVLDVADKEFLIPIESDIQVVGASSDMLVIDLGENDRGIKVGDDIEFKLKYMGALRAFNSEYIEKRIID